MTKKTPANRASLEQDIAWIVDTTKPRPPGRRRSRTARTPEALPVSRGHLAWVDDGAAEAFAVDGLVYTAPASHALDRRGHRRGARLLCDLASWPSVSRRTSPTSSPTSARPAVDPLTAVRAAVQAIQGPPGRFGDRKVFIAALWDAVGPELGMTLPAFQQYLIREHRARHLVLARADLVSAMPPDLVARSETATEGDYAGARYHFVVDEPTRSRSAP